MLPLLLRFILSHFAPQKSKVPSRLVKGIRGDRLLFASFETKEFAALLLKRYNAEHSNSIITFQKSSKHWDPHCHQIAIASLNGSHDLDRAVEVLDEFTL